MLALVNTPSRLLSSLACAVVLFGPIVAAETAPAARAATAADGSTPPAQDPIARIREEGLNHSQVMATLSRLTDVFGPRLTGSTGLRRASEWSRDQFTMWGLANAQLEPWGPFGRGWELRRFSAQVIAPQAIPLIAYPKAWSPGLGRQPLEAEVVHVDLKKSEDFGRFRGKLRGKIVLDGGVQELKLKFDPLATRRTEANLLALANAGEGPASGSRPASGTSPNPLASPAQRSAMALLPQKYQFFADEGVALLLQPSRQGEAGNLFTGAATVYPKPTSAKAAPADKSARKPSTAEAKSTGTGPRPSPQAPARTVSPWQTDAPPILPQITVAAEHYNRLVRMTEAGEKLRIAVDLQAEYLAKNLMAANVVAEIPGSDLADELVMLGAHLDSWHSGTGATDNAAGSAVAMEAVRILRALDLKPRRTIRVALWTGEEQGLLGSKAYVTEHFGIAKSTPGATAGSRPAADGAARSGRSTSPTTVEKKPAHDRLSAYFNLDNGGGRIRGIYLQNNEAARPIFREWLKPFRDLGAETVSLATTAGTDHLSFDAVGLPGFQFIQDEIEYWTRTHHGNMDVYDRVVADDLKQAAVIMATFVYQAAMRDEKLPRKPGPIAPPAAPRAAAAATANGRATD